MGGLTDADYQALLVAAQENQTLSDWLQQNTFSCVTVDGEDYWVLNGDDMELLDWGLELGFEVYYITYQDSLGYQLGF